MKYKVGDKIIMTENWQGLTLKEYRGKIIECLYDDIYGIGFEKNVCGHNCAGNCEEGHGWYIEGWYFKIDDIQLEFDF